jgi:carbon monoxide dehydrogenase subunit G
VASCLPGATITGTEEENVYDGSMRLKIGPMRVEYRGRATLSEVDEANHTAVISLSAREAKGQGSAMATIRNQLSSVDGGTKVSAQTDLQITGPQAQFGRGVIEDVGKRVLGEFSQRLEERIAGSGAGGSTESESGSDGAPAPSPEPPRPQSSAPAELDVGSLVTSSPAVRRAGAGALALALVALVLILLRRRR